MKKAIKKYAPKKKVYANLLGNETFRLYAYQIKYIADIGNWNGFILYKP